MKPPGSKKTLFARLRAAVPTRAEIERLPLVGRLAHRLGDRTLWRPHPESLARGAAIGVFWAFVAPVAQVVFACLSCVWWRANVPLAVGITFITNPLTIGPWLLGAYRVGSWIIGNGSAPPVAPPGGWSWIERIETLGWPTLVGMGTFAVGGALLAYLVVLLAARARLAWRIGRRGSRRSA